MAGFEVSTYGRFWVSTEACPPRLFATLKVELVHDATWDTRSAARTELFEYIELLSVTR